MEMLNFSLTFTSDIQVMPMFNQVNLCHPTITPIPVKKKASLSPKENLPTAANVIVNVQLVTRLGSDSLGHQLLRTVLQLNSVKV